MATLIYSFFHRLFQSVAEQLAALLHRPDVTSTEEPVQDIAAEDSLTIAGPSGLPRLIMERTETKSPYRDEKQFLMTSEELHEGLLHDRVKLPMDDSLADGGKSPTAALEALWKKYLSFSAGSSERILMVPILLKEVFSVGCVTASSDSPILTQLKTQIISELDRAKQPNERNIHFIWTGSLPEAAKQYIKIMMESSPNDLNFYLAYDPRGYLAPRLKSAIYRTAQARVNRLSGEWEQIYYNSVIQLQNSFFETIRSAATEPEFNQCAMDFMVSQLGENREIVERELQVAKDSFKNFESEIKAKYGERFQLVDLKLLIDKNHPIYRPYVQEMWLRGNLPSAGDLARSVLLESKGGTYLDVDAGPLINDEIFDEVTLRLEGELHARIGPVLINYDPKLLNRLFAWVKFQAVENFIAKRNPEKSGLWDESAYEIFGERITNSVAESNAPKVVTSQIQDLVAQYVRHVRSAPEKYIRRYFPESYSEASEDVVRLFQPLKQPNVLPNGLAMQSRPSIPFGYDINVLHGRKGASVFRHYWGEVNKRYEALRNKHRIWDDTIPEPIEFGSSYRLDGLVPESAVTGETTGPKVFEEAIFSALLENINDESIHKAVLELLTRRSRMLNRDYINHILTAPIIANVDTLEHFNSTWRVPQTFSQPFHFEKNSKYDRQIVIQIDAAESSALSARYFNNRHRNSVLLNYDQHQGVLMEGDHAIAKLRPQEWGNNVRVILVGNPVEGKLPVATSRMAQLLIKLVPRGSEVRPIARIKLAWESFDRTEVSQADHRSMRGRPWLKRLRAWTSASAREEKSKRQATEFAGKLLKELRREQGARNTTVKVYGGPVEVDVMGRTWITHPDTGLREHRSLALRALVKLTSAGKVEIQRVESDEERRDILRQAPAFHSKEAQRKAVILVTPEQTLKENAPTEFHKVVQDLWKEQPDGGFYAMSQDANGQVTWWEYAPFEQKSWAESWRPFEGKLEGQYAEVSLIGHGDRQVGLIDNMPYEQVFSELIQRVKTGSDLGLVKLLVCNAGNEGGMGIANGLRNNNIKFSKIIASEYLIYLRGRRIAYQADKKHQHGTKAVVVIERTVDDDFRVTRHVLRSDEMVDRPPSAYVGPFEYAEQQQRLEKSKGPIRQAGQVLREIAWKVEKEAEEKDGDDFVAVLDKIDVRSVGLEEKYFISVINKRTGTEEAIGINPEDVRAIREAQKVLFIDEAGHPGTMNTAFAMRSFLNFRVVMDYLKDPEVSTAEKLTAYVNLTGAVLGVFGEGAQFGKTIAALVAPGGKVHRALSMFGELGERLNSQMLLMNIFSDAKNLNSDEPIHPMVSKVNLGFNIATYLVQRAPQVLQDLAPQLVEVFGEEFPEFAGLGEVAGAVGEFTGPLAVPLIGLGIGAAALAEQIEQYNQEAHNLYKYLSTFYQASNEGIYSNKSGVLIPMGVPISETNLRIGKVISGKVELQATEAAAAHGSAFDRFIQRASGAVPQYVRDKNGKLVYLNILRDQQQKFDQSASEVYASATPRIRIHYDYADTATSKSSDEYRIDQWIQAQGPYEPSNSWGNLRAVLDSRSIQYEPQMSRFVLDNKPITIFLPPKETPSNFLENTTFLIEGFGSTCIVRNLYSKTQLILRDQEQRASTYHLEIPEYDLLEPGAVAHNGQQIAIKEKGQTKIIVDISGLQAGSTIACIGKNGKVRRSFKLGEKKAKITALNMQKIPNWENQLRQMSRELADFVVISQGTGDQQPALWDTKNNHLIIPPENFPKLNADPKKVNPAQLVGITDKYVFFLDKEKQTLLQTNRLTNQTIASYELKFNDFENDLQISSAGNRIYLTQKFNMSKERVLTLLHELKEDGIELNEVRGLGEEDFWNIQKFPKDSLTILKNTERNDDPSVKYLWEKETSEDIPDELRELLEAIFAWKFQLPEGRVGEGPTRRAKFSEWVRLQTRNEGQGRTLLFNVRYNYSILLKPGAEKSVIIDGGWYPPETGGGWLVLWDPKTEKAIFVKLRPSAFNPAISEAIITGTDSKPIAPHTLADDRKVAPFQQSSGLVTLVTEDGRQMFIIDAHRNTQLGMQVEIKSYNEKGEIMANDISEKRRFGNRSPHRYRRPALAA